MYYDPEDNMEVGLYLICYIGTLRRCPIELVLGFKGEGVGLLVPTLRP
jgi:hypothetical protein